MRAACRDTRSCVRPSRRRKTVNKRQLRQLIQQFPFPAFFYDNSDNFYNNFRCLRCLGCCYHHPDTVDLGINFFKKSTRNIWWV